jgi:hypothetical protein
MIDSKDPSTTDAAREALDSLFAEFEAGEQTDAQRWAVYGYIYGLDHAGVLSREEFNGFLDRLRISGSDAEDAGVAL